MTATLNIGMIGDFDAKLPSHVPTNEAIHHAAAALQINVEVHWLGTLRWARESHLDELEACDGLWAAPGSPYRSLEGALGAIRFARERGVPFTGT